MPATIGILADLRPVAVELTITWIIRIEEPSLTSGCCRINHLHIIFILTCSWWKRWRRCIGTPVGVDVYLYFCNTGESILSVSIYSYPQVSSTHIAKVIGFGVVS